MRRSIKAYVSRSDGFYVAECVDAPIVTQGRTLDETMANLQEAVALYLDGEDLVALDLAPAPALIVTMELEPAARAG